MRATLRPSFFGLVLIFLTVPAFGDSAIQTRTRAHHDAARLDLRVELPSTASLPPSGLTLQAVGNRVGALDLAAAIDSQGHATVGLPRAGLWEIRPQIEGFWIPSAHVDVPGSLQVEAWPAAVIQGRLKTADGSPLPKSIRVRLTGSIEGLSGEEHCPVTAGRFSCSLPAATVDLRLRVTGYVSHFYWDYDLSSRSIHDFGDVVLRPGSSVVGWVATEDGRPFDASTRVSLLPQTVSAEAARSIHPLALRSGVDRRGFFHFSGVEAGTYQLLATQKTLSSASARHVQVVDGFESKLAKPMVLTLPRRVAVQVWPRRADSDTPWGIQLVHQTRTGPRLLHDVPCDGQGYVELEGLPRGTYDLLVVHTGTGRPFHRRSVTLDSDESFWSVDLELVSVVGEVLLGDTPVEKARLIFGGATGHQGSRLTTDDRGRFEGTVPEEGFWTVDIRSSDPPIRRRLSRVEIRPRPGNGAAEVEIRLPDTRIAGQVVDAEGQPQAKAMVFVRPEGVDDGRVTTRTDAAGAFEILGLPEGGVSVAAEAVSGAESPVLEIEIEEGRFGTPELDLVVVEKQTVQGSVVSDLGPVPGAVVYFRQAGALLSRGDQASTDGQGRFELELPADIDSVHVQVRAPGYGFYLARHPLGSAGVQIRLDKVWGDVELKYNLDEYEWLFAQRNGATAWFGPLRAWAQLHGGDDAVTDERLRISRLAAGDWSFCRVQPGSRAWSRVFAGAAGAGCRPVRVVPGSLDVLDLTR